MCRKYDKREGLAGNSLRIESRPYKKITDSVVGYYQLEPPSELTEGLDEMSGDVPALIEFKHFQNHP